MTRFIAASLLCVCFASTAIGQTDCTPTYSQGWGLGSTISIVGFDFPSGVLSGAVGRWETACGSFTDGSGPSIFAGYDSDADLHFDVHYMPGNSTNVEPWNGACGSILDWSFTEDGHITEGAAVVWERDIFGTPCHVEDTLAHEIGHLLGFQDAGNACSDHIMGPKVIGSGPRSITSEECDEIRHMWKTYTELNLEVSECNAFCNTNDSECTIDCHDVEPGATCGYSPVLIDLDRDGIHLSGVGAAVKFDYNGDAVPEVTTWTTAGEGDAFLARDLNRNGCIDDGRELFGNHTTLPDGGRARHGYEALSELDAPQWGGNGDGHITPTDAIWPQLVLWVDLDHDGICSNDELLSLRAAGVVAIATSHSSSMRRDQHGNLFRYKSFAILYGPSGHAHVTPTYDVFFRSAMP